MLFPAAILVYHSVYSIMVDPYLALYICAEHFDECLKCGVTHRAETRRGDFFIHFLFHPSF